MLNPISFVENSNFVGNLDEDNGNFDTSGILYEMLHNCLHDGFQLLENKDLSSNLHEYSAVLEKFLGLLTQGNGFKLSTETLRKISEFKIRFSELYSQSTNELVNKIKEESRKKRQKKGTKRGGSRHKSTKPKKQKVDASQASQEIPVASSSGLK